VYPETSFFLGLESFVIEVRLRGACNTIVDYSTCPDSDGLHVPLPLLRWFSGLVSTVEALRLDDLCGLICTPLSSKTGP
jgi:hypothetical protein